MEELKDIVDFLLQTPPDDIKLNADSVEKALTTLSEILKVLNPQNSVPFNDYLQRTLILLNEKIHVSDATTKCSLFILNYLFSNNYYDKFPHVNIMQIILKFQLKDFHEMLQTHSKYVQKMIVDSIRCSTDQRNESIDLALKILLKLAKSSTDHQLVRKYLTENDVIVKLIPLLFIDIKEQRKLVISIIMAVTSTTFSFTTVTAIHIQSLKSGLLDEQLNYVKKIEGLLRLNDEDWHQIWCCVIRLLGLELHKGGPLYVNALLEVLEEAFKSSLNSTRISAFQCWQELILNFAIDIEELCTKKRIKLLLIPLKASNCKAELVALEKFKTWWLLLCKMSPRLFVFIEEALIPFLNFCFSIVPTSNSTNHHPHKKEDNLYLGRRFPMLLPHLIDVLLLIIGHRTKPCKCSPRVVQGDFIDLNRDNLTKISKILMKSVNQATLLVSKSSELQKTVDCLWYSLLQIIRKDNTSGIREEFITNVIEIIDKLLAKNCVDVAAVIFEETILEKAWLFSSLDHEIQFTQNMADKRKLIFSIKKPLVLYNFINVLLEGGSGDSSIDMVNNILFNVNFLLTLHETEIYNYFVLLNEVIIRLPRIINTFLCTPIEYLRRENRTSIMLNKWIELYRQFFCENNNYSPDITVEFCVYLETVPITNNIDTLIGNILNICIPKLNIMSVPNICIEKILKILIRLIENEKCLVLNSFNKLLKMFYMNYGAISIIFKSLPNFLKYQQNFDDFFNVLSTIGDIIAKVSTDTFLLTLILTSLKNFETISANDVNESLTEEAREINIQVSNLIKKCKLKLKSDVKTQNNRSAKMVAMSTTEIIPVTQPTKIMEKPVPKTTESNEKQFSSENNSEIIETPKDISKDIESSLESGQVDANAPPSLGLSHPIVNLEKITPLRRLPRILPKPIEHLTNKQPNNDFVVINSNWKFNPQNLTEKQKERMKDRGKDIPALYQDLSQSNSQDLFKTCETDENLKENRTQNLASFKNAIAGDGIESKIPSNPPVPETDKKRTRRRTIVRRYNVEKSDDAKPSTATTSNSIEVTDQNIAPMLENLFSNNQQTGGEIKLKIKAERELKKLQINCKRSLTVMGTAEKKTLRSRELSTVSIPNSVPSNDNKKRSRKSSTKTHSSQELSHEESEEVIESSQESLTSKISKINCTKPNLETEIVSSNNQFELKINKCDENVENISVKSPSVVLEKASNKRKKSESPDCSETNKQNETPDKNVQTAALSNSSTNTDSMVNKLHCIIKNNFSDVENVQVENNPMENSIDSIPTTGDCLPIEISESNVFDKDTESITENFVEEEVTSTTNASFVEYKNADNSVLATSMMSSPKSHSGEEDQRESNELEKTQEFLNNTLNISPIKENSEVATTNNEIITKENKSPEAMFSEEEEKNHQPITGSESLIDFNVHQSPSSKRKLHRGRGRSAQLLDLLPDAVGDTENIEVEHETNTMKPLFKSNNLLTFEKELPSPLAKPSTSIMKGGNKRKQPFDVDGVCGGESDSPKSKRKRVSFHDPPVSCEKQYVPDIQRNSKLRLAAKVFKKSQKSLFDLFKSPIYPQQVSSGVQIAENNGDPSHANSNGLNSDATISNADHEHCDMEISKPLEYDKEISKSSDYDKIDKDSESKDHYLIEPPTESLGSIENSLTETLNNVGPFYPELTTCTDSIDRILVDLTSPLWVTSLKTVFNERQIYTIGQFAALSELELNRLPLREHKIHHSRMALSKYLNEQTNGEKMVEKQPKEENVVKCGVKRKRRFSLSLLERDREEMTLEAKKGQLESIFGNCTDPSEMSTLLKTIISIVGTENTDVLLDTLDDNITIRHLVKRHENQESFVMDVLKYVGLNKSLEIWMKYAISVIGSESTYEKCVSTLKNITGIDYTEDIVDDDAHDMSSMSTTSENEKKLLNTTEMCVKLINSTAETVCEKLTSLIQKTTSTPEKENEN